MSRAAPPGSVSSTGAASSPRRAPTSDRERPEARPAFRTGAAARERPTEPCLHCGHPVAVRLMGCKGGHCPNCRHPYPHGDCSD